MEKTYYHLCVKVFVFDAKTGGYKLWFVQTFSSKRNFKIWRDGFSHGCDHTKNPQRVKLGEPYVKYRDYEPNF